MKKSLMLATPALFALGMITSVSAQSKTPKTPKTSTVQHRRVHVRHDSSRSVVKDPQGMDKELAKLETRTSKTMSGRRVPDKKVMAVKTPNHQERQSNPPINFTYSGKAGSTSHNSAPSRRTTAPPMKAGPRVR